LGKKVRVGLEDVKKAKAKLAISYRLERTEGTEKRAIDLMPPNHDVRLKDCCTYNSPKRLAATT